MPSQETQPVTGRNRWMWVVALGAIALLALIAMVAVVAFVSLDFIRAPTFETNTDASNAPIVAPAPTEIRPNLFAPPSAWLDEVG